MIFPRHPCATSQDEFINRKLKTGGADPVYSCRSVANSDTKLCGTSVSSTSTRPPKRLFASGRGCSLPDRIRIRHRLGEPATRPRAGRDLPTRFGMGLPRRRPARLPAYRIGTLALPGRGILSRPPGPPDSIKPEVTRGLSADVVIEEPGTGRVTHRPGIGTGTIGSGLPIQSRPPGIPGEWWDRPGPPHLLGNSKVRSWEYPDLNAAVELLQNCKLYIGTDSGVSHLAALAGARSLIFRDSNSGSTGLHPANGSHEPTGNTTILPPEA